MEPNTVINDILYEIFTAGDARDQAAFRMCCKATSRYQYTHKFDVYVVTPDGINIEYNTGHVGGVQYNRVANITIWRYHISRELIWRSKPVSEPGEHIVIRIGDVIVYDGTIFTYGPHGNFHDTSVYKIITQFKYSDNTGRYIREVYNIPFKVAFNRSYEFTIDFNIKNNSCRFVE